MAAMATPTTYDDLLARVRALMTTGDRVPVVGISGHGGAGKSTLALALGADLGLEPEQVVSTDWCYATTCGPEAGMWAQHDWLLLEALVRSVREGSDRLLFDLDPATAGARAKARNLLQGDDRAELDLWDTKWIPEGHDYAADVRPERLADLVIPAAGTH